MKRKYFAAPYLVWMVLFTIIPMAIVCFYAFTSKDLSFSLENIGKAFDPLYMNVLLRSLWYAFLATVLCLLIGYPVALILSSKNIFKKSGTIILLFILPMWMNFLLRTYALMNILDDGSIVSTVLSWIGLSDVQLLYTPFAIVFGLVYDFLPFMILPIYSVMSKTDNHLIESAEDLGANAFNVFRRITFPLSLPGVLSGVIMVFMPACTTFTVSRLLGGGKFLLYGDAIENQFFFMRDWHLGATLSLVMMAAMLLSTVLLRRYDKGGKGGVLL